MGDYDNELSKIVAELNRAAPSQKHAPVRSGQTAAPFGHTTLGQASLGQTSLGQSLDELLHAAAGRA